MDELEKLRLEMSELKQNLDKQQIINKQLMRNVMKQRASWLGNLVVGEIVLTPILFLIFLGTCVGMHVSPWYAVILLVICVIDAALDWKTLRISPRMLATSTIIQIRRYLIWQKKTRFWQTLIGTVLAVVWLVFFCSAAFNAEGLTESDHFINIGGAVGGIVGSILGVIAVVWIYRKAQRTNDSILGDLKDIEEE